MEEENASVLQWNRLSRFNHIIWTVLVGTLSLEPLILFLGV